MYRIEFEPGDVGVFRSVEEIATAIKSGMITTRARIYHQATDKWLPIEFHPHYKRALEIVAGGGTHGSSTGSTSGPVVTFAAPSGPRHAIQLAPPEPVVERRPEPVVKRRPEPVVERRPEPAAARKAEPIAARKPEPEPEPEPPAVPVAVADEEYEPIADRVSGSFARHAPAPEPEAEPELEPALEPAPFAELLSLGSPAELSAEASQPAFPPPEPRPIFRPRLRLEIAGKPRRSFVVALGGVVLVCTTQLGLTVPERFGLDIRSLGLFQPGAPPAPASVPRQLTAPAPVNAPAAKAAVAKPVVATPAPQASPSFGSSSAFTAAAPWPPAPATQTRRGAPPATTGARDSIVVAAPSPSEIAIAAPVVPVAAKAAPVGGRLTAGALVTRYQAAYAAARAELETGFRTAGFGNVFAAERLVSPQGVRAARLSAGTASAYVAKYRRREGEIEQAYADSFATMSKLLEWSADDRRAWENHQVLREKPEIAKLASFLLGQIDSLYGVLSSQERAYEIKGGTITFQDAKAANAYSELSPWLDRRAHQWADTASGVPTTAARVLRAIGSTKPPEGGAL